MPDYLFLIKIILYLYPQHGQTTGSGPKEEQGRHRKSGLPDEGRRQSTTPSISRNGPREKLKRRPTTPSSSTRLPTTASSPASPNSASTSPPPPSSKNTKSWARLLAFCLGDASRTALLRLLRTTAGRLCSLRFKWLRRLRLLLLRPSRLPKRERHKKNRNDAASHLNNTLA